MMLPGKKKLANPVEQGQKNPKPHRLKAADQHGMNRFSHFGGMLLERSNADFRA